MIASFLIFYITITLFAMTLLGVYGVATRSNLIKKIIMLNVMGDAINMLFILIGYRLVYPVFPPIYEKHLTVEEFLSRAVDPVPQALVLTAVVIGMAMNILLATYAIQFYRLHGTIDARDMAEIMRGERE
ncbi:sodium:proton antiporter [Thermococcus peptonophilus]